tara:strand:- start:2968 stop:3561 length:594 start_codon:yes stop_codon:yes gene_type:complete
MNHAQQSKPLVDKCEDLLLSSDEDSSDEEDKIIIKLLGPLQGNQVPDKIIDLSMLSTDNESEGAEDEVDDEEEEEKRFLEYRAKKKQVLDALDETEKNIICYKFFAAYQQYIPGCDTTALYTLLFARIKMTQANAIAERNIVQSDYSMIPDGYHDMAASKILEFLSNHNIDYHEYDATQPGFYKELCEKYDIVSEYI